MRAASYLLIFFVALAGARPAAAQSPLEGPLAAPASPRSTLKPVHKKAAHTNPAHTNSSKTAHRAQPQPVGQAYDPAATPQSHPIAENRPQAADPLSLGMKWNGSNDSARETRIQNYGGDASGTGAEVGMKLHF